MLIYYFGYSIKSFLRFQVHTTSTHCHIHDLLPTPTGTTRKSTDHDHDHQSNSSRTSSQKSYKIKPQKQINTHKAVPYLTVFQTRRKFRTQQLKFSFGISRATAKVHLNFAGRRVNEITSSLTDKFALGIPLFMKITLSFLVEKK